MAAPTSFASGAHRPLLSQERFRETVESFRAEVAPQNPDLFESFASADFLRDAPPIDRIAVTEGPGLEPTLWVGINFARMLAALWKTPIVPVDHMEGHIVGSLLPLEAMDGAWQKLYAAPMPAVALLISGGHTELVEVRGIGDYRVIGKTRDDAVGEAFDKAARQIGLPYPGGPHIEKLSRLAREENLQSPIKLPRPMIGSGNLDFSFSGLKTAVLYAVRAAPKDQGGVLSDDWKKGLAREFEQAVAETLGAKLRLAVEKVGARSIMIGGGVSANRFLQDNFKNIAAEKKIPLFLPSQHISGDNALMIAIAGAMHDKIKTPSMIRAHGTKSL
jgi:N6-L-threonylcarbamoyladenine synthase